MNCRYVRTAGLTHRVLWLCTFWWHLGFYTNALPMNQGFDTTYGYLAVRRTTGQNADPGFDFRLNGIPIEAINSN